MKAIVMKSEPWQWYQGLEGKTVDVIPSRVPYANQDYCTVMETSHNYDVLPEAYHQYLPHGTLILLQNDIGISCEDNEDAYVVLQPLEEVTKCLPSLL